MDSWRRLPHLGAGNQREDLEDERASPPTRPPDRSGDRRNGRPGRTLHPNGIPLAITKDTRERFGFGFGRRCDVMERRMLGARVPAGRSHVLWDRRQDLRVRSLEWKCPWSCASGTYARGTSPKGSSGTRLHGSRGASAAQGVRPGSIRECVSYRAPRRRDAPPRWKPSSKKYKTHLRASAHENAFPLKTAREAQHSPNDAWVLVG